MMKLSDLIWIVAFYCLRVMTQHDTRSPLGAWVCADEACGEFEASGRESRATFGSPVSVTIQGVAGSQVFWLVKRLVMAVSGVTRCLRAVAI